MNKKESVREASARLSEGSRPAAPPPSIGEGESFYKSSDLIGMLPLIFTR